MGKNTCGTPERKLKVLQKFLNVLHLYQSNEFKTIQGEKYTLSLEKKLIFSTARCNFTSIRKLSMFMNLVQQNVVKYFNAMILDDKPNTKAQKIIVFDYALSISRMMAIE